MYVSVWFCFISVENNLAVRFADGVDRVSERFSIVIQFPRQSLSTQLPFPNRTINQYSNYLRSESRLLVCFLFFRSMKTQTEPICVQLFDMNACSFDFILKLPKKRHKIKHFWDKPFFCVIHKFQFQFWYIFLQLIHLKC